MSDIMNVLYRSNPLNTNEFKAWMLEITLVIEQLYQYLFVLGCSMDV